MIDLRATPSALIQYCRMLRLRVYQAGRPTQTPEAMWSVHQGVYAITAVAFVNNGWAA